MDIVYFGGFRAQSEGSDSTSSKLDYLANQNVVGEEYYVSSVMLDYYTHIRDSVKLTEFDLHYEIDFVFKQIEKNDWLNYDDFPIVGDGVKYVGRRIDRNILYIGISLGGFFAYYFAKKFSCPAVIINPCYSPAQMLKKYVDEMINPPDFGYFRFTQENLDEYSYFETMLPIIQHSNPEQIKVVVNNDDETIPFATQPDIERLRKYIPEGELIQYPTGGHRATNFPAIVEDVIIPMYQKLQR